MALLDLTADTIDGQEPQRVNNILLYLDLTTIGLLTATQNSYLSVALHSFPLPQSQLGVIEAGRLNETRKFAGRPRFPQISIAFKDWLSWDVAGNLSLWRDAAYNPAISNGQIGWASGYKVPGYAILYPPDGTKSATPRQWNLIGCWLSEFNPGEARQDDEGMVYCSGVIQYDKFLKGVYGTPSLADVGF